MHTYTVLKNPNKSLTIQRDGNSCLCPKGLIVIPVNDQFNGQRLQPTQMACSTNCPFARVETRKKFEDTEGGGRKECGEEEIYAITCEGQRTEFVIEPPATKEVPKGEGLLVSL